MRMNLTLNASGSLPGTLVVTHINGQVVVGLGTDKYNLVNLVRRIDELIVDCDHLRGELVSVHNSLQEAVIRFVPLETVDEPQSKS